MSDEKPPEPPAEPPIVPLQVLRGGAATAVPEPGSLAEMLVELRGQAEGGRTVSFLVISFGAAGSGFSWKFYGTGQPVSAIVLATQLVLDWAVRFWHANTPDWKP